MLSPKTISLDAIRSSTGRVGWRSPSNIALVKYWGKRPNQIPENPSISLTLSESYSETFCAYTLKDNPSDQLSLIFFFEGVENPKFGKKIERWLSSLMPVMPWLGWFDFRFESANSFPHSAGIASSASAMSAIAMCLCDIESALTKNPIDIKQASNLARLGSGSACRSIFPHAALWGNMDGGYDEYAVPMSELINPIWHTFKDAILIVDKSPKSVSSTVGHGLMEDNIFAPARYQQAQNNIRSLLAAMQSSELEVAGAIIEQEALALHAMMMLSDYILLKPGSLAIIDAIRGFRKAQQVPLYFTIDAGPNIHLLYPEHVEGQVNRFIESHLKSLCQDEQVIYDTVGNGPQKIL